jgi:AraC-like DNA-binding protein
MKTFLLAGFIQGVLLALFFLFNKTNKNAQAQKWLGMLLLLVSITIGFALLFINNDYRTYPYLIRVGEVLPFLFPPAIYFYTISLIYGEIKISYKHLILLLPFLIGVLVLGPFYISETSYKLKIYNEMQNGNYPFSYRVLFGLKSLYGLTMLLVSFKSVIDVKKKMRYLFSNDKEFQWLIYSLGILLLLWVVGTSRALMGYTPAMGGIATVVVVFIYTLSYFTLKQKQVFREQDLKLLMEIDKNELHSVTETIIDLEETEELLSETSVQENVGALKEEITKIIKYKNSTLSKEEAEKVYKKIGSIVQEQSLFLDKSISLQQLSLISEIKSSIISETLNKHYNITFYIFINKIRSREAAVRLKNPSFSNLTIDAIGEECGFKSKSTFYQSFKEHAGQTPKEYKKQFLN